MTDIKPMTDEELAELDLYLTGAIDTNEWFPPKRVMALRERLLTAESKLAEERARADRLEEVTRAILRDVEILLPVLEPIE